MQPQNPAAQLVRETLDAIVSPDIRDALVARALAEATKSEVPALGQEFIAFVDGPLRHAIEQGLGPALAESLLQELRGAAAQREAFASRPTPRRANMPRRSLSPAPASSRQSTPSAPRAASIPLSRVALTPAKGQPAGGAWRSDQYPAGAARTLGLISEAPKTGPSAELPASHISSAAVRCPASAADLPATRRPAGKAARPVSPEDASAVPIVLVATSSGEVVMSFEKLMTGRAEVAPIQSVSDLVLLLDAAPKSKVVLVVDCPNATIRPTAVAALADELSHRVSVILWGADAATYQEVLRVSPRAERFLMCAVTASADAVVARCRAIVG